MVGPIVTPRVLAKDMRATTLPRFLTYTRLKIVKPSLERLTCLVNKSHPHALEKTDPNVQSNEKRSGMTGTYF